MAETIYYFSSPPLVLPLKEQSEYLRTWFLKKSWKLNIWNSFCSWIYIEQIVHLDCLILTLNQYFPSFYESIENHNLEIFFCFLYYIELVDLWSEMLPWLDTTMSSGVRPWSCCTSTPSSSLPSRSTRELSGQPV